MVVFHCLRQHPCETFKRQLQKNPLTGKCQNHIVASKCHMLTSKLARPLPLTHDIPRFIPPLCKTIEVGVNGKKIPMHHPG